MCILWYGCSYARVQEELRGLLNAEYRIDTSNLAAGVLVAADASDLESVKIHHKVAGGNVWVLYR